MSDENNDMLMRVCLLMKELQVQSKKGTQPRLRQNLHTVQLHVRIIAHAQVRKTHRQDKAFNSGTVAPHVYQMISSNLNWQLSHSFLADDRPPHANM